MVDGYSKSKGTGSVIIVDNFDVGILSFTFNILKGDFDFTARIT